MAVNGLAGKMISAGFYYKTFMWPSAFWEKVYEPLIRRAAGLGTATYAPDPDAYEATNDHCDVLVVGGGAAGLAAARAAGGAGARVILCEREGLLGGGLLLDPALERWRGTMIAALEAMPEVRYPEADQRVRLLRSQLPRRDREAFATGLPVRAKYGSATTSSARGRSCWRPARPSG